MIESEKRGILEKSIRLYEQGHIDLHTLECYIETLHLKQGEADLKVRWKMQQFDSWEAEEVVRNLALKWRIRDLAVGSKVAVYQWGRDCDMCESDSVSWIDATLESFLESDFVKTQGINSFLNCTHVYFLMH